MNKGIIDKISLVLVSLMWLTLGYMLYQWLSVNIWNIETSASISNFGNEQFKSHRLRELYLLTSIILLVGFKGVYDNNENVFSSWAVISVLTLWTFGLFLLGLLKIELLSKISIGLNGVLTAISFLLLISMYGIMIAVFTIPISLSLAYYELKTGHRSAIDIIPLKINLLFVSVPSFFIMLNVLYELGSKLF